MSKRPPPPNTKRKSYDRTSNAQSGFGNLMGLKVFAGNNHKASCGVLLPPFPWTYCIPLGFILLVLWEEG